MRWCWVNFQCRGVLLIWFGVGQGPTALAVGAGGGCVDIFTLIYPFIPLSPSLWETARYRLKYCLKGPLSPKQQPISSSVCLYFVLSVCPVGLSLLNQMILRRDQTILFSVGSSSYSPMAAGFFPRTSSFGSMVFVRNVCPGDCAGL